MFYTARGVVEALWSEGKGAGSGRLLCGVLYEGCEFGRRDRVWRLLIERIDVGDARLEGASQDVYHLLDRCASSPSLSPSLDQNLRTQLNLETTTAPAFIASALLKANLYAEEAKFLMISTEGGSISLRTPEEGGGNYAHHASKVRLLVSSLVARTIG